MNTRTVFLVSQHLGGIGHLYRTAALASAIARIPECKVVLFSGGPHIEGYRRDPAVELVRLPSYRTAPAATNDEKSGPWKLPPEPVCAAGSAILMEHYERWRPRVIITEFYPFAPERFGSTLDALLARAERDTPRPHLVCSLREFPTFPWKAHEIDAAATSRSLTRRYQSVWIHTDPAVCPPEMVPGFVEAIGDTPAVLTGYVAQPAVRRNGNNGAKGLLATVGGGADGAPVLTSVLEALRLLPERLRQPCRVICGPRMPASDRELIRRAARAVNAEVLDQVNGVADYVARSERVVSMAGYNTVVEAVRQGKPTLLMPRGSVEQSLRAECFAARGLALTTPPGEQRPAEIAGHIRALCGFQPTGRLDTNGAEIAANQVRQLLEAG